MTLSTKHHLRLRITNKVIAKNHNPMKKRLKEKLDQNLGLGENGENKRLLEEWKCCMMTMKTSITSLMISFKTHIKREESSLGTRD